MKAKKPFSHYLGQTTYETIFLSTATPADIESLINCLKPNKAIGSEGFIKSTDYLPTDHRLTDHRPLTHRPKNHRPNENVTFKRLENMRTFILQNVNTAGKIENYTSVYYF